LESIPSDVPYLSANEEDVARWRKNLPEDQRLRVGISWQGNPDFSGDRQRSIPLAQFAPLASVPGVCLVSLQKGFGYEQLAAQQGSFAVTEVGNPAERSLTDTAALIKSLDPHTTGPGAHSHPEDDVFFVTEGTMSVLVGDEWIDAPTGTLVLAPGGCTHTFDNRSDEPATALNIGVPGGFEPSMPSIVEWFHANPPSYAAW
jgi:mannose-6-phosphate isomerase-like protein (cupin superfamily)